MDPIALNTDLRARAQAGDAALFNRSGASPSSDFGAVLGKLKKGATEDPAAFARRSAESFVAIGLVQPLLKQLRESNHAAPPFAPTNGEKQFRSLADAELAQRMVHVANFPLVDRIAKQLMDRASRQVGKSGGTDAPGLAPSAETTQATE